jgi:ubiquinone/menaquinone biosynthesis C-methylase UbiE
MKPEDVKALRCPETGQPLRWFGALDARGHLLIGRLDTEGDGPSGGTEGDGPSGGTGGGGATWPVSNGIPNLFREAAVSKRDRFMRSIYNRTSALHDPAVKVLLPLFQHRRETEDQLREAYLPRMALGALPKDRPARILEVSVGTGANLPRLWRHLPKGQAVEVWGLDLSAGMVAEGRRKGRITWDGPPDAPQQAVRVVLGDAHHLPFADGYFDRVFHVGGINGFGDIDQALREMARVARPGTPIVVVDEQLDASRPANLWHRLTFKAVTFYDSEPHSPVRRLPAEAQILADEQPSRFFYALTWCMPGAART